MSLEKIKYTNGEVTVIWQPKLCIHSAICAKGLPGVFDPKRRPWVDMTKAETQQIIDQVRQCPSGALSYLLNDTASNAADKIVAEAATILKVEVAPNGPYLIKTKCLIVHSNGKEEIKTGTVALCRCGASANKPYCDGQHKKIDFEG
jgi:uncharacterized Fe-S cluster protein YjdI